MTLYVASDGETVTIHGNTGLRAAIEDGRVTEFSVSEHVAHLVHFHDQLGKALDAIERADNA